MELHHDDLFRLEYASAQDLLLVEVSGDIYNASDITKIFSKVVACNQKRCIHFLLLDFSKSTVAMNELEYKETMSKLAAGLMSTCIRKVARVATTDLQRELKVNDTYQQILQAVQLKLEFRNFASRMDAIK